MQILVIDDEEGIRTGLKLALENIHEVQTASSAKEGIATIRQSRPDIILLDMFMEDGKGDVVLDFLAKEAPQIPVIVISAFSTEVLQKEFGKNSTQWIHYRKPIDIAGLRELLASFEKRGVSRKGRTNGSQQ